MNSNTNPLWNELSQDEQDEFLSIHSGDSSDGEDRLNELLDLAMARRQVRDVSP